MKFHVDDGGNYILTRNGRTFFYTDYDQVVADAPMMALIRKEGIQHD